MSKQQAKSFILAMIEAGSNIQAIGKTGYVRAEPVVIDDEEAFKRIDRVAERFGNVAHLNKDIIDYLIEMGRVVWPHDLAWAELELVSKAGRAPLVAKQQSPPLTFFHRLTDEAVVKIEPRAFVGRAANAFKVAALVSVCWICVT